jgi:hypothetical protein
MDKPTIKIDGQEIEFAPLDSYTMDEAMVLWDYTKMTLDQVTDIDGFVPGVVAGLIHVSIQRANPQANAKAIRKQVGALPLAALAEVFEDISVEVDDAVPPAQALEPPSADSGPDSNDTGEPSPENTPDTGSGQPGSLTSLEDFARVIWEDSRRGNLTASTT